DLIDAGKDARAAIIAVARDDAGDVTVRMQAVRQLGTRRATEATDACLALLNHENAAMRFRAATALGRIGNAAAVEPLLAKLTERDLFAHYAIFTALKRIGLQDPKAWPLIVQALANSEGVAPEIRTGAELAMRDVFDVALVKALAAFMKDHDDPAYEER